MAVPPTRCLPANPVLLFPGRALTTQRVMSNKECCRCASPPCGNTVTATPLTATPCLHTRRRRRCPPGGADIIVRDKEGLTPQDIVARAKPNRRTHRCYQMLRSYSQLATSEARLNALRKWSEETKLIAKMKAKEERELQALMEQQQQTQMQMQQNIGQGLYPAPPEAQQAIGSGLYPAPPAGEAAASGRPGSSQSQSKKGRRALRKNKKGK